MNNTPAVQHLTSTLEKVVNLIDDRAGIVPAPDRVELAFVMGTPDQVAVWARALFGCGIRTDDAGVVFAERWLDSITILRIQADGDGVL